ncbi:hypothetical protein [Rhizobium sp. BK491]|uniref:hypothetical protein n=1 Tax=Rhizobium sp. BK491 TaxID=2587009 RepID=UPI00160A7DD3|nr:hypothetical protein [Rhizobium sp. BK491]MBB3566090.1 hypothetical protein [Rhizobium sp. BK491]
MSYQPRRTPLSEIVEALHHRQRTSVANIVAQAHLKFESDRETYREVARDLIEGFHRKWANAFGLAPGAFAQIPADMLDQLIASTHTQKELALIPDAKISVDFTSTVTVNGRPLPEAE